MRQQNQIERYISDVGELDYREENGARNERVAIGRNSTDDEKNRQRNNTKQWKRLCNTKLR